MLRVLHLYAGNLYGGIETFLVTLAKTQPLMPEMQHEFGLCFPGRLATELEAAGAIVHLLGEVRIRNPWTVWQARSRFKALLKQQTFDVVICHACWVQAVLGSVVKACHLPLVFYAHDVLAGKNWLEKLAGWTRPDLIVANSHYTRSSLVTVFPDVPSQVLYCPVLSGQNHALVRQEVRSQFQTPQDRIVIVQACRLEAWKGHQLLISALGQLKQVPNWEMWIAGGAQRPQEQVYLASLQAESAALGIDDRVKFLGQRSDVRQILAAADLHCQPNLGGEPFGIAFIEALYAGLPVVTTAIGAAPEIVDETCGVLVKPGDSGAIAQTLAGLITDAEKRDRLSSGGVERAIQLCHPVQQLKKLAEILS